MSLKMFLSTVVALMVVAVDAAATPIAGPIGYNGHDYYLLPVNTWTASEAEAQQLGGHLVTVNDAAENLFILNTFTDNGADALRSLWIGLTDSAVEGTFVWVSGEPVTYLNWAPNEPNNLATRFGPENFGAIWYPAFQAGVPRGSWNDYPDFFSDGSIPGTPESVYGVVEVASTATVPEAGTLLLLGSGLAGLLVQRFREFFVSVSRRNWGLADWTARESSRVFSIPNPQSPTPAAPSAS